MPVNGTSNGGPISAYSVYKKKQQEQQQTVGDQLSKKAKRLKRKLARKQAAARGLAVTPPTPVAVAAATKKSKTKTKRADPKTKEEDPSSESLQLFKWLISPITPAAFLQTYWERRPLHVTRKNRRYYGHVLDSTGLDRMLRDNLLFYTRNVDVVSYENDTKELHNPEGRVIPTALWDFYANGCSVRILNPQTYNRKVHLLIATLQEYFGAMVGANVYLTPPGTQGFAPHFDDIEAFVVQLEGRKHWKLYQPRNAVDVLTRESSPNLKRSDLNEPFMEVTLESGDLLYFPRGTVHEGRTDNESHSLHITVSVYQHTAYVDLLEHILPAALKKAAENDVEFRQGLPLNYLKNFGVVNKPSSSSTTPTTSGGSKLERRPLELKVKKLMETLINYVDIDNAADKLGRKFIYDSMPPVMSQNEENCTSKEDGDFLRDGKVLNRIEIDLETKVRLVRYHCIRLVVDDEGSPPKLYYNTENAKVYHGDEEQWLELDNTMVETIKTLQNAYPNYVQVQDLPLNDISVVSDLWEHGILVTSEPLPIIEEFS